jgi:hypothetical protein
MRATLRVTSPRRAHGLAEGAADDEVDLVHRLWCQRRPLDAGGEKLVVEGFDVVVAEPSQPDPPQSGQDVAVHVALVSAVGAGGQSELLPR